MWESYSCKLMAWQRRKPGMRSYSPSSSNDDDGGDADGDNVDGADVEGVGTDDNVRRLHCNRLEQASVYISTLNREQDELCIRLHS